MRVKNEHCCDQMVQRRFAPMLVRFSFVPRFVWLGLLTVVCCAVRADEIALAALPDSWRYFKGTSKPPDHGGKTWKQIGYDDSAWLTGHPAFVTSGYGATPLLDMAFNYMSVYLRKEFVLEDPGAVKWLILRMDYSDGFVAYINGHEVVRRNLSGTPGTEVAFDAVAARARVRGAPDPIDISAFKSLLVPGRNVVAIQAQNNGDFDFGILGELLANFTRGPFVQNASTNAIDVIWHTPLPSDSAVEFGTNTALGTVVRNAARVTEHVLRLEELQPDTTYYYRVRGSDGAIEVVSPIASFRTLKMSGPIQFVVLGDSGSGYSAQLQIANVMRQANPDLVLHAGDVIYPSFTTSLVDIRCLSIYRPQMKSTPFYFTIGNHDLYAGPKHYLNAFSLPTNNVPLEMHSAAGTSPEHYYSFDHGDAHFTVLFVPYINQYQLEIGDTQYRWFTNDLATTTKQWKFLLFHVPMDTSSLHRFDDYNRNGVWDGLEIKRAILPEAARHGVQLVFAGHDHVYERFNPTNGVHGIVTGGGGIGLYGLSQLDAASAFFWSRHNCVRVTIDGDTLEAEALGLDGQAFDSMTIQRALPAPAVYRAKWHSPSIETIPSDDGQGNINGQTFDFDGLHIPTLTGKFSNLGRVFVSNDRTNLYVGMDRVMIYGDNSIFLFIESPRLPGVANLSGIGNGDVDPDPQGADGLDLLTNLAFENFAPAIGCILGDEMGDGQFRSFARRHLAVPIGQGAFKLNATLDDVAGIHLQQFHHSPQIGGGVTEENANMIELAIPLSELGGLQPGERIKLGAVVGAFSGKDPGLVVLDSGYLGAAMEITDAGSVRLKGVEVILASDPDPDSDGLDLDQELAAKTDPANPDTDGDGLLDGWEIRFSLDPLSPEGEHGRRGDPDDDRFTNFAEQIAGTNPRDPRSVLSLELESLGSGRYRISWAAVEGKRYQLQFSDNPFTGYREVATPASPLGATEPRHSYIHEPAEPFRGSRFYRLMVLP